MRQRVAKRSPISPSVHSLLRALLTSPLAAALPVSARGWWVLGAPLVAVALVAIVAIRQITSPSPQTAPSAAQADLETVAAGPVVPPTPLPPLRTYVVQEGDSLLAIADELETSMEVLRIVNGLESFDLIQIDQVLFAPPAGSMVIQADSAQTLRQVAQTLRLDAMGLAEYNGVPPDHIDLPLRHETVVLPPGAVLPQTLAPGSSDGPFSESVEFGAERPQQPTYYEVRPGDNLTDIAWRLGIDIDTIVNNNDKLTDVDRIRIGERLLVLPVSGLLYRVEPGDSLSLVAERFGIDMRPILDFNRLDDAHAIQAGMELVLPGTGPSGFLAAPPMSVPYRSQRDGTPWQGANCGPVALGMGLESLGIRLSSTELRRQVTLSQGFGGNNVGTLIDALARVAQANGTRPIGLFEGGRPARWTADDVRAELRAGRPVIAQTRFRALPGRGGALYAGDHYIILVGMNGDRFLYHDPMDYDGPGYNRQMTALELERAMNASDRRWAYAAFSLARG